MADAPPDEVAELRERVDASDEVFRLLVSSVRDYAIFLLDPRGNIATWNPGAERFKGYQAHEIIGTHFSRFYMASDVAAGKCEMELEVAAREGRFEEEGWRVRKDGTQFWANVVISAVRDRTGALIGFSKVTRDLTERKASEEERAARLAAEQANRAKDEFLAMLGHELRNPLAPILTALQLLELRGDDRSAKEHRVIERQVKHMMHLVDDLLDIARITRGKVELRRTILDVRDVLARALETSSPLLEERQHRVNVALGDAPLVVFGDEPRLLQVFGNLLTNAAKYTEPGGMIDVVAQREGDELVVSVRDTGIGVEPALLPRIFELFVQGEQSVERARGGLGLGLSLVHSLVALHGGRVTAESLGVGKGSTFSVRLPAAPASAYARPQDALATPAMGLALVPKRIMLVDDNDDARTLLAEVLGEIGHEVRSAGDGPQALELAREFRPDIAILDIGLPVMDGYELAAQLRARYAAAPVRFVALSGYGQENDRARSQAAGFVHHLVKPVDLARLLSLINEREP